MSREISIVGAGLGGLVAALMLTGLDIPVTVFEAESGPGIREQGGLLDIHAHNGQRALFAAGLGDDFRALIVEGGQQHRVLDPDGTVLLDASVSGRPEVHRGELRELLMSSLPKNVVRWGHEVSTIDPLGKGRHRLHFANGASTTTDLLIGADGAWSRVRPLLSPATPTYVGRSIVETLLFDADFRHPAAAAAVGRGSMFAVAEGKRIGAHRERHGTLHTYVTLTRPLTWFDDVDFTDTAAASTRIADEFTGWAPQLTSLITDGDVSPVLRPLFTLPVHHRWARVSGVALLGDAAHLAPSNGEGANLAMLDGALLATAIARCPGDFDRALAEYEVDLFPRGAAAAAADVGDATAEDLIDFFTRASSVN